MPREGSGKSPIQVGYLKYLLRSFSRCYALVPHLICFMHNITLRFLCNVSSLEQSTQRFASASRRSGRPIGKATAMKTARRVWKAHRMDGVGESRCPSLAELQGNHLRPKKASRCTTIPLVPPPPPPIPSLARQPQS